MKTFIGPPPSGQEVRHKNGDRADPRLSNLEYGTRAENIADAKRHGTFPLLENRPGAKLTREQAMEISRSGDPTKILAERFGVSTRCIYDIRSGTNWQTITGGPTRRPRKLGRRKGVVTRDIAVDCATSIENSRILAARHNISCGTVSGIRSGRIGGEWTKGIRLATYHVRNPDLATDWKNRAGGAKITPEQAIEIVQSPETSKAIAARFGVCPDTIHKIRQRRTFAHITVGFDGPRCCKSGAGKQL
jgi:hypothetical protein